MGRSYRNSLKFPASMEVRSGAPLDDRQSVETVADLTTLSVWQASDGGYYHYKSMPVTIEATGEMYVYIGASGSTTDVVNPDKWMKVGAKDASELQYTDASGSTSNVQDTLRQISLDLTEKIESEPVNESATAPDVVPSFPNRLATAEANIVSIQSAISKLGKVFYYKGDLTSTILSSINGNSIKDLAIGYAFRCPSEMTLNAAHSVKGVQEVMEENDMMLCVTATDLRDPDDETKGFSSKWLVVQANISADTINAMVTNALQGVTSSFDYYKENIWSGSEEPTMADYTNWLRQPAVEAKNSATTALAQVTSSGVWCEITRANYNTLASQTDTTTSPWSAKSGAVDVTDASGKNIGKHLVEGVKYIITDQTEEGALKAVINTLFVHCKRSEYDLIVAGTPPTGFNAYSAEAYYYITEEDTSTTEE